MTPLIGIVGTDTRARHGQVWDQHVTLLQRSYTDAIGRSGGIALIIVADDVLAARPGRVLEHLDGLILVGGGDVDPALYDAEPAPQTSGVDRRRDDIELSLLGEALARDLPLLGICRGMELINVARGGTLHQHLPDRVGHDGHLRRRGTFESHRVRLAPETVTARVVGGVDVLVRSHHHQSVADLGQDIVASGWSVGDGVIEAIELADATLAVGVQWHPEADADSALIGRFAAETARRTA